MFIEWKKDLEIGVEEIDNEHRGIIDTFQNLHEKMKCGEDRDFYDEMIAFLDDYVEGHLAHEEAYQIKVGYDKYNEHKAKHDEFRHILKEIKEDKLDVVTNLELIKISKIMKDWLLHHILEEDMKIGDFIKNNK